jgi:hypothetical protein
MKSATALLLAVCVATVCATLPLSVIGGRLTAQIAWLSLAAGVACAAYYWRRSGPAARPMKLGLPDWLAVVFFAGFALRAFCWLVFTNGDSLMVLSPNNLGDLCLHLTYIRYIAKGVKFWPQNPIYSGIPLHYPAGIDIFNALLSIIGCDDFRAMIWVGLAGSAVTCYALLRWGGWFAVMGFLCNSGLAGWRFFHHFAWHIQDYQQAMDWKSIPLSMFVTQRGLLYAIPAGLLLLTAWRAQWFRAAEEPEPAVRMPLWVQVILYGTMPLFHLHTFLFLSAMLGWWLIFGHEGAQFRQAVADVVVWAVAPATVCVSLVTGLFQRGASAASVVHLKAGWMQDGHPFFRYWFMNFGILPLLALALLAWIAMGYRDHPKTRIAFAFVFPSLTVFGVACVVMFAPWEWDNMKIMIWSYLALLPFLHEMLLELPAPEGMAARAICYLMLFFSGAISLVGGLDATHTGYEISKLSELEPVRDATRFLPPESTFAGYPTYNHPLLLSGCKMAEGYAGHLFSHGIDYEQRDDEMKTLMMGAPQWEAIVRELKIRYLFWGSQEAESYAGSAQPWKDFPVAAAGPWGTIYDLGALLPPAALNTMSPSATVSPPQRALTWNCSRPPMPPLLTAENSTTLSGPTGRMNFIWRMAERW